MGHHLIPRRDAGRHHQPAPLDAVPTPADAAGIGLALHAVQLRFALEAHPFGAAQQQPVGSAIGARRQPLEDVTVQMLAQPGVAKLLGIRLQRVVREGMLCPGRAKEGRALRVVPGKRPSPLEGFGLAHQLHSLARFTQAGIVGLAGRFQASEQDAFLGRAHAQRHLTDKGGRALGSIVSGSAPDRHGFLVLKLLGQSF
jgi:hypothetical protein